MTMRDAIEHVLEETIRPALARHRGNVEVVRIDETQGVVYVRMHGTCVGCPAATMTLKGGIEMELKERVPGVTEVVPVV